MSLFGFGKKKEEKKTASCCCGSAEVSTEERSSCCGNAEISTEEAGSCCCSAENTDSAECCCGEPVKGICCVKVLGAGCKSCHEQYENAKAAVKAMGLDLEVEYITDMEKVMTYGVMSMPAIVVNEKVVSMGKVLKAADVEKLLRTLEYCHAKSSVYLCP